MTIKSKFTKQTNMVEKAMAPWGGGVPQQSLAWQRRRLKYYEGAFKKILAAATAGLCQKVCQYNHPDPDRLTEAEDMTLQLFRRMAHADDIPMLIRLAMIPLEELDRPIDARHNPAEILAKGLIKAAMIAADESRTA